MKVVYICHTVYHLMMTVVRLDESADNHVVLMDTLPNVENFAGNCQESGIFSDVKVVEADIFKVDGGYPEDFRREWADYFSQFDEIAMYNDDTYISHFIYQQNLDYVLFEDGFNYFQYPFDAHAHQSWWSKQKPGFKFVIPRGWSETCKRIELNTFEGVPLDDRRGKMIEVSQKELFSNISNGKRRALSVIFPVKIPKVNKRSTLILTQPLAADGMMKTEKEQQEFYENLCRENVGFFKKVYFKPHPRDTVKYSMMKNVIQIDKNTPIEIFALADPDFRFKKGVTHSSTALEFADYVNEKIILEDLRNV